MGSIVLDQHQPEQAMTLPDSSAVLYRNIHEEFPRVIRGEGSRLTLADGRSILDAAGGAAVSCIGHGNRRVKEAMIAQLEEVDEQGSEAMEAAMKLARQFFLEKCPPEPSRTRFIARKQSYHGTTLGALSMGGHASRRAKFEPMLLDNISKVSPCFAYRHKGRQESDKEYVSRLADELDAEFQKLGPGNVCAFVAEPIVGAALGCVPAVPGYFQAMRAVCDKYGALLILDEVAHPLACAAALEVQRIIRKEDLIRNVATLGNLLSTRLDELLSEHPNVGDIRGRGFFWGIELVADKSTKRPFPAAAGVTSGIVELGLKEPYCIAVYPGTGTADGVAGDHIIVSPAYNTTAAEIEEIASLVYRLINDYFASNMRYD
ncbi:hypothetical protein DL766_003499 [Monosporascus sp. MC13-8B]|uniref:Ornithine aminotransferase n=1 Tax=Monosporascus cannonballus TaxID=155416 RepID=A0ABY0HP27_9PEZI|nr:hypothetical protein DL763_005193 [Monosporascus cannonballus]RYO95476.1 hypothetical protein DL762_000038 [Monosporascus cannonballus]RYP33337.1 hypothetical protein DL766_003499 [Monosporascus sp. MC13-8B]